MPNPTALGSFVAGLKKYREIAEFQLKNNTVVDAYEMAGNRKDNKLIGERMKHKSRAEAVGVAMVMGAATFLAPPVMIGRLAVKDYQDKRTAEMLRGQLGHLTNLLRANGVSDDGAEEMAYWVVFNKSAGGKISGKDFNMWMIVVATKAPELGHMTHRFAQRVEW